MTLKDKKHEVKLGVPETEYTAERRSTTLGSVSLSNWMVNEGPKRIFFFLWALINVGMFVNSFMTLSSSKQLTGIRDIIGLGLPFARGAADTINLNCAILLFTVCRNLMSMLRTTFLNKLVPFDKNITFHIVIAWWIVFWSYVHCVGHYFNYLNVEKALLGMVNANELSWTSGPGLTGQIITIAFFLIVTSASEGVRRKYFEIFWFTHHLFIVFFGVTLIHGSFCFIKSDPAPGVDVCRGGATFYKWWILSAVVFVIERVAREVRGRKRTFISKVVQHPSKVCEVQVKKQSIKTQPGQYVFICCPEISPFEWHPFTLTSSPHEDFISLHIRVVGDWTSKFAQRLGCESIGNEKGQNLPTTKQSSLPLIMVDGPYGSASEDWDDYEVAVLVGAGIGVTPFASILKTIWYRLAQENGQGLKTLKKVYFIWTCREKKDFEWFAELLKALENDMQTCGPKYHNFLSINSYLTSKMNLDNAHNLFLQEADESNDCDAITGLKARTFYGRPNFDEIFKKMRSVHAGIDIGVFFCGPKVLSGKIHQACNRWTETTTYGTRFFYGKENF